MENRYASILNIIGTCIICLGIIGSFILGDIFKIEGHFHDTYNWRLTVIGIVSSIISGAMFLGLWFVLNRSPLRITNRLHYY